MMNKVEMNDEMMELVNGGSDGCGGADDGWGGVYLDGQVLVPIANID